MTIPILSRVFPVNEGDHNALPRENWLAQHLAAIPSGSRILDAGAGELAKKKYCSHLTYVSQDFGQYSGTGNGAGCRRDNGISQS